MKASRIKKEKIVDSLIDSFNNSQAIYIFKFLKDTAQKNQKLRKELKLNDANMYVAKNTLLRMISTKIKNVSSLKDSFSSQVSLVFCKKDAQKAAAIIKKNGLGGEIKFIAGLFDGVVIDESKFKFISEIPSLDVLRAQLCGVLLSPLSALAYTLQVASEKKAASETEIISESEIVSEVDTVQS